MMNKALIIKKSIRAFLKRDRLLFSIYRRLKDSDYKAIGWDLAITDDNELYAIEYNLGFGIEGTQITRGGLRRRM